MVSGMGVLRRSKARRCWGVGSVGLSIWSWGGGVRELVDFDVGVVVADSVAGEGGQVVEQVAEGADWVAVGIVFGGGLGLGGRRAACGGDGVVPVRRCFVGEGQRRPGLA